MVISISQKPFIIITYFVLYENDALNSESKNDTNYAPKPLQITINNTIFYVPREVHIIWIKINKTVPFTESNKTLK